MRATRSNPAIPYAEARRMGHEQEQLLDDLAEGISNFSELDWAKVAKRVG